MSSAIRPNYYSENRKYEPIKVIQDWELSFALGNVVKYVSRAGRKKSTALTDLEKRIQDLEKAKQYLDFEIEYIEEERKNQGEQV